MTCLVIDPAAAQVRVEVTPHFGMYLPFGTLVEEVQPDGEIALRKRQLGGLMAGARLRVGGRTTALEATVGYSPGLVAVTTARSTTDVPADVAMASLRGVLRLHPPVPGDGEWRFHLAPGVGLITRTGEAWAGTEGTTDPALILAGGGSLRLEESPVTLRLEFEDYVTWADFDSSSVQSMRSRVHHDLVCSFGAVIVVGGGGL